MANYPPNAPAYQQPPPQKKSMSTCLIVAIVLLALAVPLCGILAALGIYGVRRYISAAKTAEARNNVTAIARSAAAAYERDSMVEGRAANRLCSSAVSTPVAVPSAAKTLPNFETGSETAGWRCLKFAISTPVYYQYAYHHGSGYLTTAVPPGRAGFEAAAVGDLNGDGVHSKFALSGAVSGDRLTVSTTMFIENEFE